MSGLAWKLRRLRAMTAGEIWDRSRVALRDRYFPPAYASWTSDGAYGRLFPTPADETLRSSRLAALVRAPLGASGFEAEIAAAAALLNGRWSVFGHEVSIGDPPHWSANPITGAAWPDLPSARLDYRRSDVAGGARVTWEIGRLTFLPTLALAFRASGEDAYAARALRWLDDWTARNPLGHGIHHTSGLEMSIRIHTVCWTLALLGERAKGPGFGPCIGLLAQQALYCRDHQSLGSSANNHLIAEYAAMTTMGAVFPSLRGADALLEDGFSGLEREVLRQFHFDGVNAEQAFGYLPFIWELILLPLLAAETAGRRASDDVRQRLTRSLEFARTIRLDSGLWPQIGDEDDGRLLLPSERGSRLDRVGNALAAWLGSDALSDDEPALARLLFGRTSPARAAADGVHEFPGGGYTVWRDGDLVVTFDHGPIGLGSIAAHGHADALSVTIHRGADAVVIDPGTFAYHEDPAARDRCRSTPQHSTIHFGGRGQSEIMGPFLWGAKADVRAEDGGWVCRWASGEVHHRRIEVESGTIVVHDRVRGTGAEIVFVLAPGARVEVSGTRAVVTIGPTRATFEGDGLGPWRTEPGEYAPRFGQRVPTTRLVATLTGTRCETAIAIVVVPLRSEPESL